MLKGDVNKVKTYLETCDTSANARMVSQFKSGKGVDVDNHKGLSTDLFTLKVTPKEGFATAILGNNLVALDVNITPELFKEGVLREVIRQVQVARKDAGFDVADRIQLYVTSTDAETQSVINEFVETIKQETLCLKFDDANKFEYQTDSDITGATIHIKMSRV